MTPNQLYQRTPIHTETFLSILKANWHHYNHIPEIHGDLPPADPNKKIEVRYYKDFHFDMRRYWALASVWFEGKPVMVIQNAGREGDDHSKRFITDKGQYQLMIEYLATLQKSDEFISEPDLVSPNEEVKNLTSFYGNELDGIFDYHR